MNLGLKELMKASVRELAGRPIYYVGIFFFPLFCFLFLGTEMEQGLPTRVPSGIVDRDQTSLSHEITRNLNGMQMVAIKGEYDDFTAARKAMQRGEVFGYFMIPENFEADLLAGRGPEITFYTNMTYYVPASLLFKAFKTEATYTKAGLMLGVAESAGMTPGEVMPMLQPVNIVARPLNNPELNYGIYLCNSFIPGVLQLMIMLITVFSLGRIIKQGEGPAFLAMGHGSILRCLFGWIFPQTLIWIVVAIFMESFLFGWLGFPMNGSWFWITFSEVMLVLAAQSFAVFVFGVFPNLRMALSICALTGILTFSIAAYSFPVESMYPAVGIFSWLMPARYNFLIYSDIALNGNPVYYSRVWFAAYFCYLLLPLIFMRRIKRAMLENVYVP